MPFEVFELHPVEHNQFITFEGDAGDDDEIAFELVAGGEDVLAGHQSGHNDVGAEVGVLDGGGVEARAEPNGLSVRAGRRGWARSAVLNHVFGGWELSGVTTSASGTPFSVLSANNQLGALPGQIWAEADR